MQDSTTKKFFKYSFAGAILSILLLAGGYVLDEKGFFDLEELEVEFVDSSQASHFPALHRWREEVLKKYSTLKGKSLLELPLQELSAQIMKESWPENLQISRRFPDKLKISIHAKKWQALVYDSSKKKFFGLSDRCEILPEVKLIESLDLPIVSAELVTNSDKRILVCELLSSLAEKGLVSKESLSELRWQEDGLAMTLNNNDSILLVGQGDYPLKLQRLEKVLQYLEEKQLTASVISAFYQKKVVVKLRKDR